MRRFLKSGDNVAKANRKKNTKKARFVFVTLIALLMVASAIISLVLYYQDNGRFDTFKWRYALGNTREKMCDDLIGNHIRGDMTKDDVADILRTPDVMKDNVWMYKISSTPFRETKYLVISFSDDHVENVMFSFGEGGTENG